MSISRFSELLFGEHSIEQEITLQNWRERIFTIVVKISTSLGAIAYLINIISLYKDQNWVMVGIVTIAYLWIVSVTFLKKIPYSLRAGSLIFLLYLLGVSTNLTTASSGDSRIWLITAAIFATVFLGGKLGLIMAGINFVTWLAMGLLFQLDVLNYPFVHVQNLTKPGNFSLWINTGTTALATSAATIASIAAILNNLGTSLQQSRSLADNLEENANQLQEQTIILKRRSQTLETSVQISRTVSAILDSEQILYQTAKLVKEKFNLLHVGIFLVDNSGTAVSLRASYGGGGHTIPAPGYRIPLGKGLIDWVITNSQPRAILENEDTAP
ncbi:MAG: hypothetical protein U9O54_03965, partial [Chloroflexota bacterium]|nr:hypothetical protein [Chloroflexota bacterium]